MRWLKEIAILVYHKFVIWRNWGYEKQADNNIIDYFDYFVWRFVWWGRLFRGDGERIGRAHGRTDLQNKRIGTRYFDLGMFADRTQNADVFNRL